MEKVIWLEHGKEVSYCPYCHCGNVGPCEVSGLWSCGDCHKDFIIQHRKPAPQKVVRAISANDLWEKMRKAGV